MNTKNQYHHGDLRNKLIETALEIITEEGLDKVSMRGLGARIGVSRTAPYRHFADKSALLCAIAEEGYKALTRVLDCVNTRVSEDSVTRLMNVGIAYVEFAVSNPVHYRIMFGNEIVENLRTLELVNAADTAFNELLRAVRVCQEEQFIKPFNSLVVANTLWSVAHGISTLLIDGQVKAINAFQELPTLLNSSAGEGSLDIRQIFERMGEIMFTGLLA